MNAARATGLLISAIGAALVLNFFTRQVNPDVQGADLGILAILLGLLTVGYDSLRKRVDSHGAASGSLVSVGWPILTAGILVELASFLLENQVSCSCPAFGPCSCGTVYGLMFYAGMFTALAGMILSTSVPCTKVVQAHPSQQGLSTNSALLAAFPAAVALQSSPRNRDRLSRNRRRSSRSISSEETFIFYNFFSDEDRRLFTTNPKEVTA